MSASSAGLKPSPENWQRDVESASMRRTEKPNQADAPDSCEYSDCEKPPSMTVRFRNPKEYVCYCVDHANQQYKDLSYAKYRSKLA